MEVCGERPVWSTADGSISEVCRATCGPGQWEFIAARSSGGNRVGRNWRWPLIGCDAALPVVTGSHVRSRERDTPAAPPPPKKTHKSQSGVDFQTFSDDPPAPGSRNWYRLGPAPVFQPLPISRTFWRATLNTDVPKQPIFSLPQKHLGVTSVAAIEKKALADWE